MAFEIRKISDVGTRHPVVARLSVQAIELIKWVHIEKTDQEKLTALYVSTLTQRLLRCHEFYNDLAQKIVEEDEKIEEAKELSKKDNLRIRHVPHVMGLQGCVEGFLYEAKNYLRDLLILFQVAYGCDLKDASAFTDLRGRGDSDLVKWAIATHGPEDHLTKLLKTEQEWVAALIRMRNAIEHPGGHSGTLAVQNVRVHREHPDGYIPPTWQRTGCNESDILTDMECGLHNMLTLAEDVLVHAAMHKSKFKQIAFYEIPHQKRNPECPIRIRIGASPDFEEKLQKKIADLG